MLWEGFTLKHHQCVVATHNDIAGILLLEQLLQIGILVQEVPIVSAIIEDDYMRVTKTIGGAPNLGVSQPLLDMVQFAPCSPARPAAAIRPSCQVVADICAKGNANSTFVACVRPPVVKAEIFIFEIERSSCK